MPCKIEIRKKIESSVEQLTDYTSALNLKTANKKANEVNKLFKHKVVEFVSVGDVIDRSIFIPESLIQIYFDNELEIEKQEAARLLKEEEEKERKYVESKKEEWEENREYFENDEPFTRVSDVNTQIQKKLQELYPEINLNITNKPVWEQGNDVLNQLIEDDYFEGNPKYFTEIEKISNLILNKLKFKVREFNGKYDESITNLEKYKSKVLNDLLKEIGITGFITNLNELKERLSSKELQISLKENLEQVKKSKENFKKQLDNFYSVKRLLNNYLKHFDLSKYDSSQQEIIKQYLPNLFKDNKFKSDKQAIAFNKRRINSKEWANKTFNLDKIPLGFLSDNAKEKKIETLLNYFKIEPQGASERIYVTIENELNRREKFFTSEKTQTKINAKIAEDKIKSDNEKAERIRKQNEELNKYKNSTVVQEVEGFLGGRNIHDLEAVLESSNINIELATIKNNGYTLDKTPEGKQSDLFVSILNLPEVNGNIEIAKKLKSLVYSEDFTNWFGDWLNNTEESSKIVDENGEPKLVYHGSGREFSNFEEKERGSTTGKWKDRLSDSEMSFMFTDSPNTAFYYAILERQEILKELTYYIRKTAQEPTNELIQEMYKKYPAIKNWVDSLKEKGLTKEEILKEFNRVYQEYNKLRDLSEGGAIGNMQANNEGTKQIIDYLEKNKETILKNGIPKNDKYNTAIIPGSDKNGYPVWLWSSKEYNTITVGNNGILNSFETKSLNGKNIKELSSSEYDLMVEDFKSNFVYNYQKIQEEIQAGGFRPKVYPVFLNAKKVNSKDFKNRPFNFQIGDTKEQVEKKETIGAQYEVADLIEEALNNNLDGSIIENIADPMVSTNYAIFRSNQIKSVFNKKDYTSQDNFYNQIRNEKIIGQANIKAMSVLVDAVNKKEDTLPHEYAHHYIAWFRNTPIVQEAIKKWGSEEALVQSIGEQVVKQKGKAYDWWKKFTDYIMDLFNNLSTKDKQELTNILTDAFLSGIDLENNNVGISRERSKELASKASGIFNQEEPIKPGVEESNISNISIIGKLNGDLMESEKGQIGVNKQQLLRLLGPTMYNKPLAQVAVKELLQNSFDAVKARINLLDNKEQGNIKIKVNYENRTISIQDDGIGMTPDIVKNAFLSIGGTNKEGLDVSERSGGFGLAKVQFLLGSEYVKVSTVKNGIKTTLEASAIQLYNDDFIINTEQTNEPNGSFVEVKIPKSYITTEGLEREIDFPGKYTSSDIYKKFDILDKPLIGNVNVEFEVFKNGKTTNQTLPLGNNSDESVLPPLFSKIDFSWGTADLYMSVEKTTNPKHRILSSGIYQFGHSFRFKDYDNIPYDIVVNIKPSVSSTSEQYPFNNQREGFKNTVSKDIDSLGKYLKKFASGEAEKDAKAVFSNITGLPKVDPNTVLTPEEREKIYADVKNIIDENEKRRIDKGLASAEEELRRVTWITIENNEVKDNDTGKVEVSAEKSYASSFKSDKNIEQVESIDTVNFNPSLPQYHNNTNLDYLQIPGAAEFFSDFGSVVLDTVRFAGNELGYEYKKLKSEDDKFFAGVSIDKQYGGVHVRKIINAIFVNPLAFDVSNLEEAVGIALHVTIHEINHTTVSGEGANFTTALGILYGKIYSTGKYSLYEGLFRSVYKKHFETFKILKNEYDKSSTRNLSESFEGNSIKANLAGDVQGNVDDVSTRQSTEKGYNGDRESNTEDRTGDIILSNLSNQKLKPGIEELFDSNQSLANSVYSALGFKSKPDVILPIGTSGSGKSTFIKSLPQENLVVIEPDSMRVEFTGNMNDKSKDKEIYIEAAKRAIQAIKQGKQVVFDTTNLTKDKRLPFIEAIKREIPTANIQYKLMELNPELAKQRIKAQIARGENRANVPDSTIDRHAESYKQMLEDIKNEPISNFELTPQQKQQAQQLYSSYLDTIFPDSKVKDIVYHGTLSKFSNFIKTATKRTTSSDSIWFTSLEELAKEYSISEKIVHIGIEYEILKKLKKENPNKSYKITSGLGADNYSEIIKTHGEEKINQGVIVEIENLDIIYPSILNIQNLKTIDGRGFNQFARDREVKLAISENKDGLIIKDTLDTISNNYDIRADTYTVFEPEQIHILGNKQDIEGFKEFVGESTQTVESYRAQEQEELSQRIPNIENYKVNGKVDKSLITDENDLEIYNEIYNKYDALITPLLEASEETKEQTEVEKAVEELRKEVESIAPVNVPVVKVVEDEEGNIEPVDTKPAQKKISKKTYEDVLAKMKDIVKILGIKVEFTDLGPDIMAKADMFNRLIQFSNDTSSEHNFTEEVLHFVIDILEQKEPQIFNKLMSEIWKYSIYKDVKDAYSNEPKFQTPEGNPDIRLLKKEAVGQLLTAYVLDIEEIKDDKNFIGSIWDTISKVIKSLFYNIPFNKRSEFEELASDILNKNLITPEDAKYIGNSREEFYAKKGSKITSAILANKKKLGKKTDIEYSFSDSKAMYDHFINLNNSTTREISKEINPTTGLEEEVEYYISNGEKRQRVSSIISESNKGLFKNISQDDVAKALREAKMQKGTEVHQVQEDIIRRFIDPATGLLRDTPEPRPENYPFDVKFYNILEDNVEKRLKSYPVGTRFLVETKIINEEFGYGGTMDFLAILPNMDVELLDWKTTDVSYWEGGVKRNRFDISPFNQSYWRSQLSLYSRALQENGVKNIKLARAIPIAVELKQKVLDNKKSKTDPANLYYELVNLNIGDINPKKIKTDEFYLIPVSVAQEVTGVKELDEILDKLIGLKDRVQSTRYKETELYKKKLELDRINSAIREIQGKQQITIFSTLFNENFKRYKTLSTKEFDFLDSLEKGQKFLSKAQEEELHAYFNDVYSAIEFLDTFKNINALVVSLSESGLLEEYTDQVKQNILKLSANAGAVKNLIEERSTEIVDKLAIIYDIESFSSADIVGSYGMTNFVSILHRTEKSVALTGRILNVIKYLEAEEKKKYFDRENGEFAKTFKGVIQWAKKNKSSMKNAYSKLFDKEKEKLISKYSDKFKEELEAKNEEFSKILEELKQNAVAMGYKGVDYTNKINEYFDYTKQWLEDSFDLKKYEEDFIKAFNSQKEWIDKQTWNEDFLLNEEFKNKKIREWVENHNIFTSPKALSSSNFLLYNSMKDKWLSDEYKELQKDSNKELLAAYNLFISLNERARKSGMLDNMYSYRTFKPLVYEPTLGKASLAAIQKLGLEGWYALKYISNFIKKRIGFVLDDNVYDTNYDPLTKRAIKKIPVRFKQVDEENIDYVSDDLFSLYQRWASHIINYELLSNFENRFKMIQLIESNRSSELAIDSKGNLSKEKDVNGMTIKNKNKVVAKDRNNQTDIDLNKYINNYLYSTNLDAKPEYYKLGLSLINYAQSLFLNLNFSSPILNVVGGSILSRLNQGNWFSKNDLISIALPLVLGTINKKLSPFGDDLIGKASYLITEFNTNITSEYDSPDLNFYKTKGKQSAKKLLNAPLTIGDHLMQNALSIAVFLNTAVVDGELVNINDYVGAKYLPTIYNTQLSYKERNKASNKMKEEIYKMKKTKSLLAITKKNGKSYSIEGFNSSQTTYDLNKLNYGNIIHSFIKESIGNYDEYDKSLVNINFYFRFVMQMKKWMPRVIGSRIHGFEQNYELGGGNYGRSRIFFKTLFQAFPVFLQATASSLLQQLPYLNSPNKSFIDYAKEVYKQKQTDFKDKGKELKTTEAEFVKLYTEGFKNQINEFTIIATTLYAMSLIATAIANDPDKWYWKLIAKLAFKLKRELTFSYDPEQAISLLQNNLFPALGALASLYSAIVETGQEGKGHIQKLIPGYEEIGQENIDAAKPLSKIIRAIPVLRELDYWMSVLDPELPFIHESYLDFMGTEAPKSSF